VQLNLKRDTGLRSGVGPITRQSSGSEVPQSVPVCTLSFISFKVARQDGVLEIWRERRLVSDAALGVLLSMQASCRSAWHNIHFSRAVFNF
jgi:hypothetical protein